MPLLQLCWRRLVKPKTTLVVGCGNMGTSLLAGMLKSGVPAQTIHIVEPYPSEVVQSYAALGCGLTATPPKPACAAGVVLLAIKPQMMEAALSGLKAYIAQETILLSIAAGTSLKTLSDAFGGHRRCVRAMPNLPATISCGVTACYAHAEVGAVDRQVVNDMFGTVGKLVWLEQEAELAAVTALSGSGPAYVFHMIECLENAGINLGLSAELARTLAVETIAGSSAMAKQSAEDATTLRQRVTSPGGTTEAALDVLMPELGRLMRHTLEAAAKRARELAC